MLLIMIGAQSPDCRAQLETTWWYWTESVGLTFESGVPIPDTSASLLGGVSGSSISDAYGNLLFYTNTDTLWDATYSPMPNGTGLQSGGASEESLVIVPRPNQLGHYYVFVTHPALFIIGPSYPNPGTVYHEIDMDLNGGQGDVVTGMKNIPLLDSTEEKICATKHANGVDYWVLLAQGGSSKFHAYLVTENGVSSTPVTSQVGPTETLYSEMEGNLQFNNRGDMVVEVDFINGAFLFDFNNATGELSNMRTLVPPVILIGAEFSPDDSKLYLGGPFQYDLTVPTQAAIQASEVNLVPLYPNNAMQGLQTGLDGKIYGNTYLGSIPTGYMSIIHDPNEGGSACNYQDSAIYLLRRIGVANPQNSWRNSPEPTLLALTTA